MISIVSFSESRGGAAKAAQKFFLAIQKYEISVKYVVVEKSKKQSIAVSPNRFQYLFHFTKRLLAFLLQKFQISQNYSKHSLNLFSCSHVLKEIAGAKLVHLNWINNETISIEKLSKIDSNLIITLHDEWFYSGTEHYALGSNRIFNGYKADNKNVFGVDWDSIQWNKKKKAIHALKGITIFTVPSMWMLENARKSAMLKDKDVRLLPNIINTEQFKRYDALEYLEKMINKDDRIILFGAANGYKDKLKGIDLMYEALDILWARLGKDSEDILVVSFGPNIHQEMKKTRFRQLDIGQISDINFLAQLYSRASFTVVPSIFEAFGQVAAESLSCETPVLAFDTSGLKDIVLHKKNGYLAKPFSSQSLADGMEWLLTEDNKTMTKLGSRGRRHIVNNFSEPVVTQKLISLYKELGAVA